MRSDALSAFVAAASGAFRSHVRDDRSASSVAAGFAALETPAEGGAAEGGRLPVCQHLPTALALAVATDDGRLRRLIEAFAALEPSLTWRRRADTGSASANYADGHGNAMVLGPGGLEQRKDVWLGATLLAPNVRYPDHDHAPEEVYLVLSDGEFRQDDGAWFAPGVGGSFYNRPGIRHAMRSHGTPLFAFWLLRAGVAGG